VKVAAYQGPLLDVDVQAALDLVGERGRECEAHQVSVLCCPEAFLGGLADFDHDPTDCAIKSDDLVTVLQPLVSETVTTIVGVSELAADGKLYNAAAVFQRGQVSEMYRKVHPAICRAMYAGGSEAPVFRTGDLTFEVLICNDCNYPELAEAMSALGATVLFIPTNNALPKDRASATLNAYATDCDIVMAVRTRCWVVRSDVSGENGHLVSFGCSEIVDPSGVVVQQGRGTGLLIVEIPPGESGPYSC
jgi:predicted amidohydrolase